MVTILNLYEAENIYLYFSSTHPGCLPVNACSSDNASSSYPDCFGYTPTRYSNALSPAFALTNPRLATSCFSCSLANSHSRSPKGSVSLPYRASPVECVPSPSRR